MNKNLYIKELKRNRKNFFVWLSIVFGFTLLVLSIFPYMSGMGEGLTALMEQIPPEIGKAMGMDEQTWSSALGFYSTYYGVYIVVLISIYTASTGAGIISKEERDRTSEFLLTRPVSRKTVFWTKIAALFSLTLIFFGLQTVLAGIGLSLVNEGTMDWGIFTRMHASGFILICFFTAIGVLISMFFTPKKNFMGMVVGLTFGTYFLNAIAKSTEATKWIGYISPFNYMEITIDPHQAFNFWGAIVLILVAIILLIVALKSYEKRDMAG